LLHVTEAGAETVWKGPKSARVRMLGADPRLVKRPDSLYTAKWSILQQFTG
jgi:hypothetical protein